jgi:hypothetical protein
MATTTNFGWETPDDTDLVKDGALAIRTLGSAIDTSLVDLKGGTTGQVLSKTSNTDMDFTWVTSDDANAIQNAIVDAKGDLITATAADTPARLAVGESGSTLVADSSASTGLRWQSANNFNGVINGGADIWQRGTSFNSDGNNFYTADRWNAFRAAVGLTVSRQTASLEGFQYSIRLQRVSGNTSTAINYLQYNLETDDSVKYANKTVTLSFWARAGANYSPTSSLLSVVANSGTGTNQKILDGFTGASSFVNSTATLTTSWQRFTYTGTVNSNANQIGFYFAATPVGTASTNDWFEITGVQLEFGSVATAFKRAGNTLAGELAACQRYYYRSSNGQSYANFGLGIVENATTLDLNFVLPVTMRTVPSSVDFASLVSQENNNGTLRAISAVVLNSVTQSTNIATLTCTSATGLTANRPVRILGNNTTAAYIGVSAEL